MALDVFFKEDFAQGIVGNMIAALSAAAAHGGSNLEYCRGVVDLARAQALTFGISWDALKSEVRAALCDAQECELLIAVKLTLLTP